MPYISELVPSVLAVVPDLLGLPGLSISRINTAEQTITEIHARSSLYQNPEAGTGESLSSAVLVQVKGEIKPIKDISDQLSLIQPFVPATAGFSASADVRIDLVDGEVITRVASVSVEADMQRCLEPTVRAVPNPACSLGPICCADIGEIGPIPNPICVPDFIPTLTFPICIGESTIEDQVASELESQIEDLGADISSEQQQVIDRLVINDGPDGDVYLCSQASDCVCQGCERDVASNVIKNGALIGALKLKISLTLGETGEISERHYATADAVETWVKVLD